MRYIVFVPHVLGDAHHERTSLAVGDRGRIVLPATLRKRLDLREGDRLILTVEEDGSFKLTPAKRVVERLRGRFAGLAPKSLTDELLAERRAEAAFD